MKDTFYFSHDYNARQDMKIKKLIQKHGLRGYGIFWAIIEDLYNNANALQTDYESIAYDLHEDSNVIESVIKDFGLFQFDGETFGSLSIQRRIDERNLKSETARKSALKRWGKCDSNANDMQTHSDSNAIKERKGKERKGKKIEDMSENKNFPPVTTSLFSDDDTSKEVPKEKTYPEQAVMVIELFNRITGKKYGLNDKRSNQIMKIIKMKYTLQDIELVVRFKNAKWANNEKMREFLSPSTLFAKDNFVEYIEEAKMNPPKREMKMVY